jgi:hypothetical protein
LCVARECTCILCVKGQGKWEGKGVQKLTK